MIIVQDSRRRSRAAGNWEPSWPPLGSIASPGGAHTLSQLLEDGYSVRAADMPGADDLMMRVYAAMAQKERELISERTRVALAATKARGAVLWRGSRVSAPSGALYGRRCHVAD